MEIFVSRLIINPIQSQFEINMKNILYSCVAYICILCLSSCSKDRVACMNPPRTLEVSVLDKAGKSIITGSNSSSVKIYYADAKNIRQYVPNIRVLEKSTNEFFVSSAEILDIAHQLNSMKFSVEINDVSIGVLSLETYRSNADCDGWIHYSKAVFNGVVFNENQTWPLIFKLE